MNEKHVLVVFPHPDDESFGSGGTIAQYGKLGVPVSYVCLTLGEMGRNMGNPPFATRESLPILRKEELIKACTILGIKDVRMLGLRDKTIEFENETLLINQLKEIIEEIQPSLIITHYPGHGVHPDHDATGHLTIEAIRQMEKEQRPKVYCMAITKDRVQKLGKPDVINDITHVVDIKIAAIKAHRSQTEALFQKGDIDKQLQKYLNEEEFWIYRF